jgi:hypothetical protein
MMNLYITNQKPTGEAYYDASTKRYFVYTDEIIDKPGYKRINYTVSFKKYPQVSYADHIDCVPNITWNEKQQLHIVEYFRNKKVSKRYHIIDDKKYLVELIDDNSNKVIKIKHLQSK